MKNMNTIVASTLAHMVCSAVFAYPLRIHAGYVVALRRSRGILLGLIAVALLTHEKKSATDEG